jgi:hypothetical protein
MTLGRCHLCVNEGREDSVVVEFCDDCGHYFCEECRGKWFDRTVEFVKGLLGKEFVGCCGPRMEAPVAQAVHGNP